MCYMCWGPPQAVAFRNGIVPALTVWRRVLLSSRNFTIAIATGCPRRWPFLVSGERLPRSAGPAAPQSEAASAFRTGPWEYANLRCRAHKCRSRPYPGIALDAGVHSCIDLLDCRDPCRPLDKSVRFDVYKPELRQQWR
jgi:hypothetical protein